MRYSVIVGFIILAVIYLWLSQYIIRFGGGWSFKNIFLILASGIIIFVPLYKKYIKAKK